MAIDVGIETGAVKGRGVWPRGAGTSVTCGRASMFRGPGGGGGATSGGVSRVCGSLSNAMSGIRTPTPISMA